jgi:phage terminase large subunit-like protein
MSNAVVDEVDRNQNIILNKKKSKEKIDPVTAIINAHVRAKLNEGSVYSSRGMRSLT